MPLSELRALIKKQFGPMLRLESAFPAQRRSRIERNLSLVSAGLFVIAFSMVMFGFAGGKTQSTAAIAIGTYAPNVLGLFCAVFSVRFCFALLEAFRRSYYLRGIMQILPDAKQQSGGATYPVADIVRQTDDDVTESFMLSDVGQEVLRRAGVTDAAYDTFMESRAKTLLEDAFMVEKDNGITLASYTRSLFRQDMEFAKFLLTQEITKEEIAGAAAWVERIDQRRRAKERWWSRDELGRIEGIGKTLSYGQAFALERYGHDITEDPLYPSAIQTAREEDDEVEAMESALLKAHEANVLLVGDDILEATMAVARLAAKIQTGKVLPKLEHKRVFRIDPNAIVAAKREKAEIEKELVLVLNHAVRAGNIIVALENFPGLLNSAGTVGIDLLDLLRPFLTSPSLQIIATAETNAAHATLERSTEMMQFFEVVRMHGASREGSLAVLEQTAMAAEQKHGVLITYPALAEIYQCAERYFPDGVMPDKAIDLLEEAVPYAREHEVSILTDVLVRELVEAKTGVPLGKAEGEERQNLIALEDRLHRRVIGQDEALVAVSKAMRRARSGIANTDRPMGSFLFLGPTGVGKTETAKALAEVLFNDEDAMHRIDMSEYSGADALGRLIGENNEPGRLSSMLREKQYGVLLLDEFEKGSGKVHDLFLQILDEGEFSDSDGRAVNARNLVIIATSNAAADMIFDMSNRGVDPSTSENAIVDEIIKRGVYRPELLNRFDGVIVFHPLSKVHITAIAHIKLEALAKRLLEKGIILSVTDELTQAAADAGFDPKFGARPMNRFIQDTVEQAVADKVLKGEIAPGASITLTKADLK